MGYSLIIKTLVLKPEKRPEVEKDEPGKKQVEPSASIVEKATPETEEKEKDVS